MTSFSVQVKPDFLTTLTQVITWILRTTFCEASTGNTVLHQQDFIYQAIPEVVTANTITQVHQSLFKKAHKSVRFHHTSQVSPCLGQVAAKLKSVGLDSNCRHQGKLTVSNIRRGDGGRTRVNSGVCVVNAHTQMPWLHRLAGVRSTSTSTAMSTPVPRSWLLNLTFQEKECRLPREAGKSRTGAGKIQAKLGLPGGAKKY